MEQLKNQEVCCKLKDLYETSEFRVKTSAKVRRAFIEKTSTDAIQNKVNAQMNSIKTGIYQINPKFKEGSKNYDSTKSLVLETLASYEQALIELSKFYDGKIEQLILRKVELEASLIGSILNEEYLYQKYMKKAEEKENDQAKKSIKDNIKSAIDKLVKKKKETTEMDSQMISKLMDVQDIAIEMDNDFSGKVEQVAEEKKQNKDFIEKVEKEIATINAEIDRINESKKKSIYDAMEVGDKAISSNIRRPRVFGKIKRFFVSRFNTAKVVENTILEPLKLRIDSFKNNELSNMQG